MSYKLILFDFDGTLANSFPYFLEVFNQSADHHRLKPLSTAEIDVLRGYDSRQIMRYFKIPFWRTPFLVADARRRMAKDIDQIRIFPGIDRVIRELDARRKILGIVSSNAHANIVRVLGQETAAQIQYFEAGISLGGKAPKIQKLVHKTRIPLEDVLLIGDEIRDIEAARKVGVACAVVAWGYTRVDALMSCHPDLIFKQVEEILEIP